MFGILRDHGRDDVYLSPDKTNTGTVCMHASLWPTRPSQSVVGFVAPLRKDQPVFWATGSSGICTSVFMPFYLTGKNIDYFPASGDGRYSPESYWWQHEKIHRRAIFKWEYFQRHIAPEIKTSEKEFLAAENELYRNMGAGGDGQKFFDFSRQYVEKVIELHKKWEKQLEEAPAGKTSLAFKLFWKIQSRKARLKL